MRFSVRRQTLIVHHDPATDSSLLKIVKQLIPLISSPGLPGSSAQNEFGLGPVHFKNHSFRASRGKKLLKAATNFTNAVSDIPPGGRYLLVKPTERNMSTN